MIFDRWLLLIQYLMSQYQIASKILLKGETNVGKTSFQNYLMKRPFDPSYNPTIGVNFSFIITTINNLNIKTQLWDLSGSQRYHTINRMHFKGTNGIILMYDITNRQSFQGLGKWVEQARQGCEDARMIVVGSKADLQKKREVGEDEGRKFAEERGFGFFEVSIKTGKNVKEAFDALLFDINREELDKKMQEEEIEEKKEEETKEVQKSIPFAWKIGGGLCMLGLVGIGAYMFRRYK